MQFIGKSEFFKPGSGVTHRDLANDQSSPRVSGGAFKHMNKDRISRKEFEFRKSITNLKDFGPPELRINQSMDVHAFMDPARESMIQFSDSPSHFVSKKTKHDKIRLPVLTNSRDFASKDLALTP